MSQMGRRGFLGSTAAMLGSWSVSNSFDNFLQAGTARKSVRISPIKDESTGLELLELPEGFRYMSFSWTGDDLSDGRPTPGAHDGMAVIAQDDDGVLTLCRNHEHSGTKGAFGPAKMTYDRRAEGGCSNLSFDTKNGSWGKAWSSLSGTIKNCAGGPTPWGTWLSCEETIVEDGDIDDGERLELERPHGYIFEVSAKEDTEPVPLKEMGRFVHEAVAVNPENGIVYETEDRTPAGFYRFLPNAQGELRQGGRLEMLKVDGNHDLIKGAKPGAVYDVSWVPIEEPDRRHSPGKDDEGGVISQGLAQGGAKFARLEGCWWGDNACYFVSTSGGRTGAGQVWKYDPASETLTLVFESPSNEVLDSPDNITVSPSGGLVLCEDGDRIPQKMHVLTAEGVLIELARSHLLLNGERNGIKGDFRGSEWAGATFSPDGKWLFANLQSPGITFAITGPWEQVGLSAQ